MSIVDKAEKSQSQRLQDFLDDYSVNVQMSGIYSYDARTLKSDPSRMVLTQHSYQADGRHISYGEFVRNPGVEEFDA